MEAQNGCNINNKFSCYDFHHDFTGLYFQKTQYNFCKPDWCCKQYRGKSEEVEFATKSVLLSTVMSLVTVPIFAILLEIWI